MEFAEKIRKIEALIAGAKSEGERQAAELAKQRLQGRIVAQPIEYTVRLGNPWKKKLFTALCQKYQLYTYRYARQKYTTAMVRVSRPFMDSVLWPEFNQYSLMFEELANEIMQGLISKIHQVKEEDEVVIAGELPLSTEAAVL
jgi:hypothetical protein